MEKRAEILEQANRSGFPFQLRVEHEIRNTRAEHHWVVVSREHPWGESAASSGFIDLVLQHSQISTLRLVIECKRNRAKDARNLQWVFLLPERRNKPTELASCFEIEGWRGEENSQGIPWDDERIWDDVRVTPASLQSEFCILLGDQSRNAPILENLAGEVLKSVEGLGEEEVRVMRSQDGGHLRLFLFPVIVTNAEIAICRFTPDQVNLDDGTLRDSEFVDISSVPFIRFRKSLETDFPAGEFSDLRAANKARQRSVFIVNASCLSAFLQNWNIQPLSKEAGFALQRRLQR